MHKIPEAFKQRIETFKKFGETVKAEVFVREDKYFAVVCVTQYCNKITSDILEHKEGK